MGTATNPPKAKAHKGRKPLQIGVDEAVRRSRGRPRRAHGAPVQRRPCEQIAHSEANNLVRALNFAAHDLSQEPNRHYTIQWRHAPSPTPEPERVTRLINLMGQWLRRKTGAPSVWAYAREVGTLKGVHLHLVVYVPHRLSRALDAQMRHWLELESAGEVRQSAICPKAISPGQLRSNTGLRSYLLKEGDPKTRTLWVHGLGHHPTGGVVLGKRIRVSHSIGPSARRAAGSAWA